ncbi:hypothetical protein [Bradyrhizobium lablabi]|uniref:hypothetical protein n=1 Tax=Bradyrhizobium lablabi TaxID=722472 RepID=UPI0012AC3396|nr:hypothetical protein [Bradyrhizobium lablabi]
MTTTETILKPPAQRTQLRCSGCGVTVDAACGCGVGYVPAHEYAAKAVIANPEKSDRAIAADYGVDHKTVGKARKATGEKSPVRIGRDKKARRLPKRKPASPPTPPAPAVMSPIDEMQPEPTALLLTQIEQLVGKLALGVKHIAHSEIFNGRVRAVAEQLLALIADDRAIEEQRRALN